MRITRWGPTVGSHPPSLPLWGAGWGGPPQLGAPLAGRAQHSRPLPPQEPAPSGAGAVPWPFSCVRRGASRCSSLCVPLCRDPLVAQTVKNPPAMQETWVRSLGWEDPLEEGLATLFSILACRIPWTEEPGCSLWS